MENRYVIGLDYGTDSARALVVEVETGKIVASSVKYYTRWKQGLYCCAAENRWRQHPLDYIEVLEASVKEALAQCPAGTAEKVIGMSFDTTGSTPAFVDETGTPLALKPEFAENPNAMFVLWKDHTAVKEAAEINAACHKEGAVDYTMYEGGIYSSEWWWAKILHVLREDAAVREAAYSVVEHCDWMPALITGVTSSKDIVRGRCAAGHKVMWHESWGGLPPQEFLSELDPLLDGYRDRLFTDTETSDKPADRLSQEWADRLGLTTDVVVGVSAFDCHMGAVGANISEHAFVRIIGTSTCDIMVASKEEVGDKLIKGICGQVDGSVIPGMTGLEAGQSAFGDVYAWFRRVLEWPLKNLSGLDGEALEQACDRIIPQLTREAETLEPGAGAVLALDWMNGRRTPDANQLLTGAITGITLGTSAPMIFRALVEATAYGSRAIVDRFRREGVRIDSIIGIGGIALKSPFVMQTLSDVLNMPIKVCNTDQACALGAAMFAATAAGAYPTIEAARDAMNSGFAHEYQPIPANVEVYDRLYQKYEVLGRFVEDQVK
ncbi:MAG: ribulokinase [Bacteroidales bacterium]|nr:ribulokinase [Bacteroidales bacterium]